MTATTAAGAAAIAAAEASATRAELAKRLVITLGNVVLSLGVIVVVWHLLVKVGDLDPFTTRGPSQVWKFLTDTATPDDKTQLVEAFKITVRDAALGLVAGTIAAVALAMAFNRWRAAEQAVMPIAMAFRAVPLVAMTPLIALIFHRGLVGVTVIAGIVTFFPTLINVSLALRSVPAPSIDLMRAYGASPGTTLWKVQLPSSLPALFASIRIAAPLALVGALLAEWLVTGKGLGYLMLTSQFASNYDLMWTAAAITTFTAVVLYGVISSIEQVVLNRYSDLPSHR